MLKAVLVDDEILAINLLEAILLEMGNIEVVGKYLNPIEGLQQINALKPDVAFLDIEMPEMTGMGLAEGISPFQTDIVFVTAYEQYALEAFNVQAVDYVLKPIDKKRLQKTIDRILMRKNQESRLSIESGVLNARFLGGFQLINKKNEPIKWRTKKVKELCAYLIHHREPVHRDKIMEDLWPEHPSDKASGLLHTTVYQLRKKLKESGIDDPIEYVEEKYTLLADIHADVSDIHFFIESNQVLKLVEFYTENYLSQEDYHWATQKSVQIRRAVIQHLERFLAAAKTETRQQEMYRSVLEKLYELDPWEEKYTMELVKYYVNLEKYKEAKEAFHKYRSTLWNELREKPRKEFEEIMEIVIGS